MDLINQTETTAPSLNKKFRRMEFGRRRLVSIIYVIYWLLILEGAIRKWIAPELEQILYFIRDPFLLLAYAMAFHYRLWPRKNVFLYLWSVEALAFSILSFFQILFNGANPVVLTYGWRNYFLYIPIAFLIAENFREVNLKYILKYSLFLAIPISVLVFYQFISPPTAFINRGVGEYGYVFMVTADHVRTTGTFSFTLGQSYFVASLIAMLLTAWVDKILNPRTLVMVTIAVLACLFVSGSRSAFIFSFFIIAILFSSIPFLMGRISRRVIFASIILLLVAIITGLLFFLPALDAIVARQHDASTVQGENTFSRIFSIIYTFFGVIAKVPLFGHGMGMGTPSGIAEATGSLGFITDDELSRQMYEVGPVMFVFYAFLRWGILFSLIKKVFLSLKKNRGIFSLMCFAFIAPTLMGGGVTAQGTVNGYTWIFVGFALSAARYRQNLLPNLLTSRYKRRKVEMVLAGKSPRTL